MKKLFVSLFLMFILCGCNSVISSSNNEILTLFSSKTQSENKIWIGTFQLVFNDMKNNILKKDIYFKGEEPTDDLKGLNNEEFNSSMLNENSYYKSYGKTSFEARDKIKADIKKKFNETSDIIDNLDWTPLEGKYYAYAMLKKEFEFQEAFDKLEKSAFNNSEKEYEFFGINAESKDSLDNNVKVLFYNNENDYAVALNTKTGDKIYLYRTDENDTLKNQYEKLLSQKEKYSGITRFRKIDTLKVPNMKFSKIRNYAELCNKVIKGTDYYFSDAIETIQFELNNKGGKVKSEAIIMMMATALAPSEAPKPRHFKYDKPFYMFLIDTDKTDPYMALRVYNLENFVK